MLDIEPLLKKLSELAGKRLAAWAEMKRVEYFRYYATRMQHVEYISAVPYNDRAVDPAAHMLEDIDKFLGDLPGSKTGKYRHAPKIIVTSEFGFGKTSTIQAVARKWIASGRHVIYAPAALLNDKAFAHSSGLTDALLIFLLPEDTEFSDFAMRLFEDTLRNTLKVPKGWLLLIDGVDENAAVFKANSLAALWGSMLT